MRTWVSRSNQGLPAYSRAPAAGDITDRLVQQDGQPALLLRLRLPVESDCRSRIGARPELADPAPVYEDPATRDVFIGITTRTGPRSANSLEMRTPPGPVTPAAAPRSAPGRPGWGAESAGGLQALVACRRPRLPPAEVPVPGSPAAAPVPCAGRRTSLRQCPAVRSRRLALRAAGSFASATSAIRGFGGNRELESR